MVSNTISMKVDIFNCDICVQNEYISDQEKQ